MVCRTLDTRTSQPHCFESGQQVLWRSKLQHLLGWRPSVSCQCTCNTDSGQLSCGELSDSNTVRVGHAYSRYRAHTDGLGGVALCLRVAGAQR